jgi:hypothetical protein
VSGAGGGDTESGATGSSACAAHASRQTSAIAGKALAVGGVLDPGRPRRANVVTSPSSLGCGPLGGLGTITGGGITTVGRSSSGSGVRRSTRVAAGLRRRPERVGVSSPMVCIDVSRGTRLSEGTSFPIRP